jgi:hypothetical protein
VLESFGGQGRGIEKEEGGAGVLEFHRDFAELHGDGKGAWASSPLASCVSTNVKYRCTGRFEIVGSLSLCVVVRFDSIAGRDDLHDWRLATTGCLVGVSPGVDAPASRKD